METENTNASNPPTPIELTAVTKNRLTNWYKKTLTPTVALTLLTTKEGLKMLPWYILGPFIFATIVYWMIGLRNSFENYIIFCCIILLINQCALSYGYLISTMSPSVQVASALGAPMMMPFLLFGGFFLKDESVPPYFIWLKYMSWFKYGFEAMLVNQWDGYGNINCPTASIMSAGMNKTMASVPCIQNGQQVLKYFDLDASRLGLDIGIMVVLAVSFRIIAFIFLLIRASRR